MTDTELTVLAAKAYGDPPIGFSPLTDDGDALRLAVVLGLVVDCSRPSAGEPFKLNHYAQEAPADMQAATRRAIVRCAAAMAPESDARDPSTGGA